MNDLVSAQDLARLDDLIAQGWVHRNPGYGHPMRPEYVLTEVGRQLAPCSGRLLETVRRLEIEPIAFRKWTMPVTWVLGTEPHRFGELRCELPTVTPRALTPSPFRAGPATAPRPLPARLAVRKVTVASSRRRAAAAYSPRSRARRP